MTQPTVGTGRALTKNNVLYLEWFPALYGAIITSSEQ